MTAGEPQPCAIRSRLRPPLLQARRPLALPLDGSDIANPYKRDRGDDGEDGAQGATGPETCLGRDSQPQLPLPRSFLRPQVFTTHWEKFPSESRAWPTSLR